MADILKPNITSSTPSLQEIMFQKNIKSSTYPNWYDPNTGIYHSKHHSVNLPSDPFLDSVTYLFSHRHIGTTALIDSSTGSTIPYANLFPMVKSIASGLHQMGIKQGDAILILLPSSIHFPIIFLGVLYIGAIAIPMNPLSNLLEINKQTKDCKIKLAFTTSDKVDKIKFPAIPVPENIYSDNPISVFHKLINSDPSLAPRVKINQEDTAAILFSSGTTGACKGVELTHRNFIAMMALFTRFEASQYEDLPSENVHLSVLPMFHIIGIALFVMGLLSLGTTIVLLKKPDPDEMVRVIERYGVTHMTIVPPTLAALTRKAKSVSSECFKSIKQINFGAAPTPKKLIMESVKTFPHVDFIQGYGMTEGTAVATRGYNTKELRNYTSVGLMAPNTEAKVVDLNTGLSVPPGDVGELLLRSAAVMKGYLNNVEETKATIDEDGWLHTGDIVYFDQDGYVYVIDRLKEMIKYKGFQIAPADLESVIMSHPDVHDVAVTAWTDEEAGEIPVAFVVKKNGRTLSEASLIEFVATKVSPYKKVRRVCFTTSIPRSPAGKILRRELKNLPSRL